MKTLVVGAPGTGKSTLVATAHRHGYINFFDTDKVVGLCEWRAYATGAVVGDIEVVTHPGTEAWYQTNGWYWKADKLCELLASAEDPVVCGSADNVAEFYGWFDQIILLRKSRADIVHNLTQPDRHQPNGKDPAHYDRILRWQDKLTDSLKGSRPIIVSSNTIEGMFEEVARLITTSL